MISLTRCVVSYEEDDKDDSVTAVDKQDHDTLLHSLTEHASSLLSSLRRLIRSMDVRVAVTHAIMLTHSLDKTESEVKDNDDTHADDNRDDDTEGNRTSQTLISTVAEHNRKPSNSSITNGDVASEQIEEKEKGSEMVEHWGEYGLDGVEWKNSLQRIIEAVANDGYSDNGNDNDGDKDDNNDSSSTSPLSLSSLPSSTRSLLNHIYQCHQRAQLVFDDVSKQCIQSFERAVQYAARLTSSSTTSNTSSSSPTSSTVIPSTTLPITLSPHSSLRPSNYSISPRLTLTRDPSSSPHASLFSHTMSPHHLHSPSSGQSSSHSLSLLTYPPELSTHLYLRLLNALNTTTTPSSSSSSSLLLSTTNILHTPTMSTEQSSVLLGCSGVDVKDDGDQQPKPISSPLSRLYHVLTSALVKQIQNNGQSHDGQDKRGHGKEGDPSVKANQDSNDKIEDGDAPLQKWLQRENQLSGNSPTHPPPLHPPHHPIESAQSTPCLHPEYVSLLGDLAPFCEYVGVGIRQRELGWALSLVKMCETLASHHQCRYLIYTQQYSFILMTNSLHLRLIVLLL